MRRLARRLVSDEHLAEDIAQETWLAKLRLKPGVLRSPKAYLATIVRHVASNHLRSIQRRRHRELENGQRPERDEQEANELAGAVRRALEGIPRNYQEAVWLRYAEGLPPREIAERLGIPVETARTRVKRGITRLRERILRELGGERNGWRAVLLPLWIRPTRNAAPAAGVTATVGVLGLAAALLICLVLAGAMHRAEPDTSVAAASLHPASTAELVAVSAEHARTPVGTAQRSPVTVRVVLEDDGRALEDLVVAAHGAFGSATARTDADGECTFDLPIDDDTRIEVAARDGTRAAALELPADGRLPRQTIRVESTRTVAGVVFDQEGRPLPYAPIHVTDDQLSTVSRLNVTADGSGAFRVAGLPETFGIGVREGPWVGARHLSGKNVPPGLYEGLEIVTAENHRVTGTVRTAEGEPFVEANVDIVPGRGRELVATGYPCLDYLWTRRATTTAADGTFAVDDTPLTGAELVVYKESFLPIRIELGPDVVGPLELVLERDDAVLVRVLGADARPVAAAEVFVVRTAIETSGQLVMRPPLNWTRETDAAGACPIPGTTLGGAATVMISAAGYASAVLRPDELAACGDRLDVVLRPERILRGRILVDEEPAASVPIHVGPWFEAGELESVGIVSMFRNPEWFRNYRNPGWEPNPDNKWCRTAHTNGDGRVEISVPSGVLEVRIGPYSDGTVRHGLARVEAESDTFEVRLPRNGLRLRLASTGLSGEHEIVAYSPTLDRQVAWRDAREELTLSLPEADDWHLFAWRTGSTTFFTEVGGRDHLDISLDEGRTVVVQLVDQDGLPLADAGVLLHGAGGTPVLARNWGERRSNWVRADARGRLRLVDVPSALVSAAVFPTDDPTRYDTPLDLREPSPRIVVERRNARAAWNEIALSLQGVGACCLGTEVEVRALDGNRVELLSFRGALDVEGLALDTPVAIATVEFERPWHTGIEAHLTEKKRQGSRRGSWQRTTFTVPAAARVLEIVSGNRAPLVHALTPGPNAIAWPRCRH